MCFCNVAVINFQCCDGASDKTIFIEHPSASSSKRGFNRRGRTAAWLCATGMKRSPSNLKSKHGLVERSSKTVPSNGWRWAPSSHPESNIVIF